MSSPRYADLGDDTVFGIERMGNGDYRISLGDHRSAVQQALMPQPEVYVARVSPEAIVMLHALLGDVLGEQR